VRQTASRATHAALLVLGAPAPSCHPAPFCGIAGGRASIRCLALTILLGNFFFLSGGNVSAGMILFPGTAAQQTDAATPGKIVVAKAVAIPAGGGAMFQGTVLETVTPNSIILTITDATIATAAAADIFKKPITFVTATYAFNLAGDGLLAIQARGTLSAPTTAGVFLAGGEALGVRAEATTFAGNPVIGRWDAPNPIGMMKSVPVSANETKTDKYTAGAGVLSISLGYTIGKNETLRLPDSINAIASVPEPSSSVLLAIGGILAAFFVRRRRQGSLRS